MNKSTSNKQWYLIQSKARMEWLAQENLQRQLFTTYLPKLIVNRKRRGRFQDITEPLFPGYLFIQLDNVNDNWSPIRSTIGVQNIVKFGGTPACVPQQLITSLQANEDDGYQVMPKMEFTAGQQVEISQGPMTGYSGIFQCKTSRDRVVILLNILSQQVKMELSVHNLSCTN